MALVDEGRRSIRRELTTAREERASVWQKMQALNDRANREKRDLRPDEYKDYQKLEAELDGLGSKIERLENEEMDTLIQGQQELKSVILGGRAPARIGQENGRNPTADGRYNILDPETRVADVVAKRGRGQDKSGFSVDDANDFSIAKIMRCMIEPAYRSELNDVERRALVEGTDASGGYLTPELLSTNIIDNVRNAARVFQAGATTVLLNSDTQSIPRVTADPTAAWRSENGSFSSSGGTFDRVVFKPQSLGVIVLLSEELFADMVTGGEAVIQNSIVQAMALELDRVSLRGTGTPPQPKGILNQSGITNVGNGTNGSTLSDYSEVMTAIGDLLTLNRQPNAWLVSARTGQFFDGLKDTTNQPLNPPPPVAALNRYTTNQIPINLTQGTSSDCTEIYVGQWSDLLIGVRLGLQLRLLSERDADTGQYAFRAHLRADVQLAHAASFVTITGVRS